jgi:hypothetical protein
MDTIEIRDYAIGGKLIAASVQVPQEVMNDFVHSDKARQDMREKLVRQLVNAMLDKGLVEIVSQKGVPLDNWNPTGAYRITARCYLAKDSDVKILRTYV